MRLAGVAAAFVVAASLSLGSATATAIDNRPADAPVSAFQPAVADRAALAALARMQDPTTGLWPIHGISAWWSSANDLTALVDAERVLGTHQYDGQIALTYRLEQNYTGPQFHNSGPDFKNNYYDDTAWWGLAWLDAYRWTGDRRYLATAQDDDAYTHSARIAACGGGLKWAVPRIQHGDEINSITNELALTLSAQLATATGRPSYRTEALTDWAWLQHSGLIRSDGLVWDHLDAQCHPTGWMWSYTQGTLLAGLTALAQETGQPSYLVIAHRLADAALRSSLNQSGVLTDPCETAGWCGTDGGVFKGADVRGIGALNKALTDHPYTAYLDNMALTAFGHDQLTGAQYGPRWAGPAPWANSASQGSATDLFNSTAN
jgi:predicted alpha-1,6-mannanase (GH76 family)